MCGVAVLFPHQMQCRALSCSISEGHSEVDVIIPLLSYNNKIRAGHLGASVREVSDF